MNRIIKLPLAAAAIALAVAACSSGTSSTTAAAPATSAAATTSAATSGPATAADAITIQGFRFGSPITVKPGATVSVTNKDSAAHNVVSDTAGLFKTAAIRQGESTTFTAPTKPGSYTFSCTFHATMKGVGTLVVQG